MNSQRNFIRWIIIFFMPIIILAQKIPTVAVLEFEGLGISENETRALTNRLRGNLVQTGEYQVIERGKMDEILKEQGFQLSGCTSEGCLVEAGQLLGVEMMLAGSISLVGSTYSVEMRLIDVGTGKITHSASYDMQATIDEFLTRGMTNAVNKLLGKEVAGIVTPAPAAAPALASVRISTEPTDAEVLVNDVTVGHTPMTLEKQPVNKPLKLEIRKSDYQGIVQEMSLKSGENQPLLIKLKKEIGRISCDGMPGKATFLLENRLIGKTPLTEFATPVGKYKVTVKKPEFRFFQDSVFVTNDKTTSISYKLQPIPKLPALMLSTAIPGSGQFYQKRLVRGLVFLAAAAGTGYLTIQNQTDFTTSQQDYEKNLRIYNSNRTQPDLLPSQRQVVQDAFNNMKDAESNRNLFMAVLGGVWTINLIDILF
jgi:TolB-like protein/TM2 domain-containing membrane protein YozV